MTNRRAAAILARAAAAALRPPARLSVSEWADRYRRLPAKSSPEPGPWRTARAPYLREIMDRLSAHDPCRRVVVMKAAQVGMTEAALNWLGYIIAHAPAPTLLVLPTLDVIDRVSQQRLRPLLEETPAVANKLSRRQRDSSNTKLIKDFPGGMLILAGANSPASLRSMPIRYVVCDEVDAFPWDVGGEGDPLGLIEVRQSAFPRRKMLLISTPTIAGASRIEEEWRRGDRRRYHVPCPDCGEMQPLVWRQLHWRRGPDGRPAEVAYACRACGSLIPEEAKPRMLAAGEWRPENPDAAYPSYHLNALYAPVGLGPSWRELVVEWLEAQNDPTKLKRFINTRLGEPWEDRSRDIRVEAVMALREPEWRMREIPPGCLVLTAGIDVQDDRLAVMIVGWGRHETSYIVDYVELPGAPTMLLEQAERGEGELVRLLAEPLANRWGRELRVQAVAIDSGGHHTHDVYRLVRAAPLPRMMAVKGASTPGRPILAPRPSHVDVSVRGRVLRKGAQVWLVGTDTGKHALHNRLAAALGLPPEERRIRLPADLPEEVCAQLLAEVFDPERNRWVKRRGRRNEALDCWVYAAAAAHHPELRVHARRARDWARLERMLEGEPAERREDGEARADEAQAQAQDRPKRRRAHRAGWVHWR